MSRDDPDRLVDILDAEAIATRFRISLTGRVADGSKLGTIEDIYLDTSSQFRSEREEEVA